MVHEDFSKKVKDITEEERNVITNRVIDDIMDSFQDAKRILGF